MIIDQELLDSAKSGPKRAGRMQLIAHLEGKKISRPAAVKAKCYDCDGMGDTGKCDLKACPLHPYGPFKENI